ncbi:MAG: hypothetical protein H6573_33280 [Lewinellaceae bacterium]|nr:hypothetical protein [Lewinellaceae bacterium]
MYWLKRYHPDFEDAKLTKEKLFRKVLPDGKFSDRRMNNLMSEGYLAAEKFLIFQRFSRNDGLQKGCWQMSFKAGIWTSGSSETLSTKLADWKKKEVKDWEDTSICFDCTAESTTTPTRTHACSQAVPRS